MIRSKENRVLSYIARGASGESAIKVLCDLNNRIVDRGLALNPNLSTEQISDLYKRTNRGAKILVASRYDLTTEMIREIVVENPHQSVVLSLLTRGWRAKRDVPDDLAKTIISRKWFSERYCSLLLNFISADSTLRPLLGVDLYGFSTPSILVWEFKRDTKIIEDLRLAHCYKSYTDLSLKSKFVEQLRKDKNLLGSSVAALGCGNLPETEVPPGLIFNRIQEVLPDASVEFFSILFSILPEWGLSVAQSVETALALSNTAH